MSEDTKIGGFCQRLTPHPIAGVRIMCCLPAYPGHMKEGKAWKLTEGMAFFGEPNRDDSNSLFEALADIAKVNEKLEDGFVIIHDVKDIDKLLQLEKEVGFWAKGLHDYDFILEIED